MPYLNDLYWLRRLDDFSDEEQKILLALSYDKYRWRSRDRLLNLTHLSPKRLERTLAHLLVDDLVRPALTDKGNIVFGLKERVG